MISPDLNTRRKINDIFSLLTLIVFVSVCVLIFALGKSNIASFGFWMRLIASLLFALMGFSLIVANIGGGDMPEVFRTTRGKRAAWCTGIIFLIGSLLSLVFIITGTL